MSNHSYILYIKWFSKVNKGFFFYFSSKSKYITAGLNKFKTNRVDINMCLSWAPRLLIYPSPGHIFLALVADSPAMKASLHQICMIS